MKTSLKGQGHRA